MKLFPNAIYHDIVLQDLFDGFQETELKKRGAFIRGGQKSAYRKAF
jgi:hypothetical protein